MSTPDTSDSGRSDSAGSDSGRSDSVHNPATESGPIDSASTEGKPVGSDLVGPDLTDEQTKRRTRTLGYLKLWAVSVDLSPLPIPTLGTHTTQQLDSVVGRAKSLCLVALKGQGLSLRESFAFADAYEVWDHLSVEENDFVLEPNATPQELVQFAWKFEGLRVMEWALGLVKHLAFPVDPADPAKATSMCVEQILNAPTGTVLQRRTDKELLDAADIAWSLSAVSTALLANAVEGVSLHPGVVHERAQAFRWVVKANFLTTNSAETASQDSKTSS
jgi:hypothetical protein